jgi:hypothetical protein
MFRRQFLLKDSLSDRYASHPCALFLLFEFFRALLNADVISSHRFAWLRMASHRFASPHVV